MDLSGRRIIVAGATGALGGALARELAARDAELGLLGRDRDRLDALAAELGGVPSAVFDARDGVSCARGVDAIASALGGLDGAVVAFGVVAFGPAADTPDEVAAELLAVNALGPIAVLRAALGHLEDEGALAAVTAITAEHPTAGLAAYSASKAALSAYLTALRREVRRRGVAVLDARLPHLSTAFADHALAGEPPALPEPYPVEDAARAIADAIAERRREVAWDMAGRALLTR